MTDAERAAAAEIETGLHVLCDQHWGRYRKWPTVIAVPEGTAATLRAYAEDMRCFHGNGPLILWAGGDGVELEELAGCTEPFVVSDREFPVKQGGG